MITPLTNQEIFDKAMRHLFIQGRQSRGDKYCTYRGSDGTKCAVGILITEENYITKFENRSISELLTFYPGFLHRCGLLQEHGALLRSLQFLHDTYNAEKMPSWEEYLITEGSYLASKYGLLFKYEAYQLKQPTPPVLITEKLSAEYC